MRLMVPHGPGVLKGLYHADGSTGPWCPQGPGVPRVCSEADGSTGIWGAEGL